MDLALGRVSELAAEVALRRCELAHNRRLGAHPHVDFLLDVVVDEGELDVLVATALARLGVDLAEKVQFRPVRTGRRRIRLVCRRHNAQVVPGIAPTAGCIRKHLTGFSAFRALTGNAEARRRKQQGGKPQDSPRCSTDAKLQRHEIPGPCRHSEQGAHLERPSPRLGAHRPHQ